MHGPDISWYVILSALLFTTGALGVMLRRSPLIILLSVEITLNSAKGRYVLYAEASDRHGSSHARAIATFR